MTFLSRELLRPSGYGGSLFFHMTPTNFPATVDDLFDALDRLVPERVPEADDAMVAIQRYAGKRELVLFLKNWRDQRDRAERREASPRPKGRR